MLSSFKNHRTMLFTGVIGISLICNNNLMAHGWVAPKEAAGIVNPVPLSQESTHNGQETFAEFCARCHGPEGKGLSASAAKLTKDAPNLMERLIHHSDGDFYWKIKNGKGDMPSFQEELSDEEVWDLINYIKSDQ